ncbi:MAG TPA: hypothetical protein EYP10_02385, partial [Armatimonadetes bacterium]|nr:hypothetical protein [Armatimonadota bacterium]
MMMERQNASRIDALLRALANRKLSPQARKVLGSYFDDVEYAWRILMRIADTPDALAVLGSLLEQLLVALSHAPDGNVALVNFERLTNSAHSKLQFLRRFYYDPAGLDALIQLLGVSNYAADTLCLHPEYLNMLLPTSQLRKPKGVDLLVREAIQAVQPFREARHKWESLRRFRRRETLRIIAGDVLGLLSYDAIVAELSALADAVLHSALQVALMEAGIRAPMGECGFLILALGKLGGQELNYSSDVDLMFIYDPDALAVHLSDTDGRRLRWHEPHKAVQDVAERIARALVHGLSDVTHHGRAYRVDMRLRPYGVHGPLVLTWQATMTYYESWAKAWERMALIKARPVAGDVPLAHRVMRFFDGIVYESPLEASAIEAIHDIKLRSEALLREAGRDDAHVKAGPGGIRDVEFTVQLLQLLGGAQFPEVRVGNTVVALAALVACGMLTDVEATQLRESYIFLRVLEHRLQIVDHLPLREMPRDTDQLEKLAHRMGYKRTDELSAAMHLMRDYQMHTQRVRLLHRRVFAEVLAGGQPIPVEAIEIYDLLERPLDNDVVQWLKQFGFERISMAQQRLRLLTYGPADVSLPWRERVMVLRALPTVLRAIAKSPSPDVALHRFEQLVSAVGNRATFISSVCSNEEALQALIRCMALSELLTELMMRYPEHIEIVLREPIPPMDAFAQVASDLLRSMHHIASIEDAKRTIRRFRHREVLRVGFGEIATILDATNASQRLAY